MDSLRIEAQSTACNVLVKMVRDFVARTPAWAPAIRYQTKPDERGDLTLISQRVYGRRGEFLVIAAAAGLESTEDLVSERLLTLPTDQQLRTMKARAGFVNEDAKRETTTTAASPASKTARKLTPLDVVMGINISQFPYYENELNQAVNVNYFHDAGV